MRIGQGIDAHRFCDGDHVILGGVRIEHTQGMAAHSDGDVLIHAICDALLGAAGMGDIGHHFPDTDASFAGIDSRILLRRVVDELAAQGMSVINLDCTLVAQAPRMAPYIDLMRENISSDVGMSSDNDDHRVNIKATTTEKMGFTGRGEGIAAFAVALLEDK